VTFARNDAPRGGGIDAELQPGDSVSVGSGLFEANRAAGDGGAIHARGAPVAVAGSIFKRNRAQARGSALYLDGGPGARAIVVNSLLFGNEAGPLGGALAGSVVRVKNVTIAENSGGGLGSGVAPSTPGPAFELWNSILAHNRPANCVGNGVAPDARDANLQFPLPATCGLVAVADPALDPFYVPLPGSAAFKTGHDPTCSAPPVAGRDLFFQTRGHPCSIGAIERPPEKVIARRARSRQADRDRPAESSERPPADEPIRDPRQ
jgi:predicted outer membrane repeat protein